MGGGVDIDRILSIELTTRPVRTHRRSAVRHPKNEPNALTSKIRPHRATLSVAITGTEWPSHPGSVGRPLRPESVRILDDELQSAAVGEIGAIWFRRPEGTAGFKYVGADQA